MKESKYPEDSARKKEKMARERTIPTYQNMHCHFFAPRATSEYALFLFLFFFLFFFLHSEEYRPNVGLILYLKEKEKRTERKRKIRHRKPHAGAQGRVIWGNEIRVRVEPFRITGEPNGEPGITVKL